MTNESILRLSEVEKRTGLKRTTIYKYIAAKRFPPSVPLGTRNVGWLHSEVEAWVLTAAQKQAEAPIVPAEDFGISSRIRRSEGRAARTENANARLTRQELDALKASAAAQGKALGEWTREVLLRESSRAETERALFTELTALRLLMTNVLRPLALGETLTPQSFQAILTGVRKDKHDAARDLLAQYQPSRTEEK